MSASRRFREQYSRHSRPWQRVEPTLSAGVEEAPFSTGRLAARTLLSYGRKLVAERVVRPLREDTAGTATIECTKGSDLAKTDEVIKHLQPKLDERGSTWVRLSTLAQRAGQKKVTIPLIEELEAALKAAGIHHSPSDLRICSPSDTVLVSRSPFHDKGLPFDSERLLAEFIERHYRMLTPFSRCRSVKREAVVGDVRIDLLFREVDGGRVVCELEHGTGRYETGSQIRRYMDAVRVSFATRAKPPRVRGVVITGEPNKAQEDMVARWCQKDGVTVDWYYYRLGLELTPAPSLVLDEDRAVGPTA
jgi:hypothetical protein